MVVPAPREDQPAHFAQGLIDAVELFETLNIGYALIGGIAAMVYGRARFTEDVDFVAADGHAALLEANADTMKAHHFDPSCTWKLYHDSGLEIDLWKDDHADGIIDRAGEVELAGRAIRIADPHDLIAMKLRADRPQDDYDISEMLKRGGVDETRVRELVTADQFDKFKQIRSRTR